jgi:anti-anti-sigma factor
VQRFNPWGEGLSVHCRADNDSPVLAVAGEIDLATASQFMAAVDEVLDRWGRVELDLRETSFMDSSGLAVITRAYVRLGQVREGVVVRGASPIVLRVLQASGIDRIIDLRVDDDGYSDRRVEHQGAEP